MWSAILSGPVPLKAVAVPRPKASKWGRRLAIFQKRSYPTFRYRRPIKMSLLCPLQMTLPGGFPGGVRGEGSADEAPVALRGAEARAGKKARQEVVHISRRHHGHRGQHAADGAWMMPVTRLDRVAIAVDGAESSNGKNIGMWRPDPSGPQGPM